MYWQLTTPAGTAMKNHMPALCPHATLNLRPGIAQIPMTRRTPTTEPTIKLVITLKAVDMDDA